MSRAPGTKNKPKKPQVEVEAGILREMLEWEKQLTEPTDFANRWGTQIYSPAFFAAAKRQGMSLRGYLEAQKKIKRNADKRKRHLRQEKVALREREIARIQRLGRRTLRERTLAAMEFGCWYPSRELVRLVDVDGRMAHGGTFLQRSFKDWARKEGLLDERESADWLWGDVFPLPREALGLAGRGLLPSRWEYRLSDEGCAFVGKFKKDWPQRKKAAAKIANLPNQGEVWVKNERAYRREYMRRYWEHYYRFGKLGTRENGTMKLPRRYAYDGMVRRGGGEPAGEG